ncbi:MAG: ATP-binding protein [Pseudomonadota bacterium]
MKGKVKCWELFECGELDCPVYKIEELKCWLISGTHCRSEIQGKFLEKMEMCLECDAFTTNIDLASMDETLNVVSRQFAEFRNMVEASEAQLKESEERYRYLFDYDPNCIFVLEPETYKILDVNSRVLDIYGYDKEELLGKTFMDLGTHHYVNGVLSGEKAVPVIWSSVYPQIRHIRKDGTPFYVNVYVCQRRRSLKYGIITTTVDITEMLEKESQLIQAGKMSTLGEMATGVAHELNQPLSVIKTASSFLKKKVTKKEPIKEEILLTLSEEIDSHVDRASRIINHLREFGRKSEVVKEGVQVNEAISRALEIFSQQLKLRQIEVVKDFQEDLPPILGDFNRLEQVFVNLLINARDAIEEKWVQAGRRDGEKKIILKTRVKDRNIMIEIMDTGIGIPKSILDKIFEPFFTTKKVGKGTGLGLSISYGIVQDYDGTIHVETQEGVGSKFIIRFPILLEGRNQNQNPKMERK